MTVPSQPHRVAAEIAVGADAVLSGELVLPVAPPGLVVFAHGSGSSRHSPRNQQVAARLQAAGLGTLLFDLLTPAEELEDSLTARLRFDIPFITGRLQAATAWVRTQRPLSRLGLGYFGASTGVAAALVAAAELGKDVQAVVSRGGRPDLAGDALPRVHSPTLLIVGGADDFVLQLNREALTRLGGRKRLSVVAGASHLFEEPGALEQVAELAADWFTLHLHPA
jgi:putative phosphoribosyl transferase